MCPSRPPVHPKQNPAPLSSPPPLCGHLPFPQEARSHRRPTPSGLTLPILQPATLRPPESKNWPKVAVAGVRGRRRARVSSGARAGLLRGGRGARCQARPAAPAGPRGGVSGGRGAGPRGRRALCALCALGALGLRLGALPPRPPSRADAPGAALPPSVLPSIMPGARAGAARAARTPCPRAAAATAGRCPRSSRTANRYGRRYRRRAAGPGRRLGRPQQKAWGVEGS